MASEPCCIVPNRQGYPCPRPVYGSADRSEGARCIIHSTDPGKDPEEVLHFVRRELWDDQEGHKGWDDFTHATFPTKLLLDKVVFPRPVYFDNSRFLGTVSLIGTTFESDAFFKKTEFLGKGHFVSARFRRQVSFEDTIFEGPLLLDQCKFTGPVYLVSSRMKGGVSFYLAILENVVLIADSSVGVSGSTNSARLNISEARIRGAGGFHLVHVNQDGPQLRLRAVNCTMQNCRFEDVNWDRSRGRLTLEDELILDRPSLAATSWSGSRITVSLPGLMKVVPTCWPRSVSRGPWR